MRRAIAHLLAVCGLMLLVGLAAPAHAAQLTTATVTFPVLPPTAVWLWSDDSSENPHKVVLADIEYWNVRCGPIGQVWQSLTSVAVMPDAAGKLPTSYSFPTEVSLHCNVTVVSKDHVTGAENESPFLADQIVGPQPWIIVPPVTWSISTTKPMVCTTACKLP